MFPLSKRKLIRGCQAHKNAGLGCAADYEADHVPLFAPFDGTVQTYSETGGGKWLRLIRADNGDKIEMAHLSKYLVTSGKVKEGVQVAVTGNTGTITTGAHKHIQIIRNGKRLDPEAYNWESLTKTFMKITIVANKNTWTTLPAKLEALKQMFLLHSSNKFEPVFDIVKTNFNSIPLAPFNGMQSVDINWYRQNITPLATGQATILLLNPEDYQNGNTWGFMTYGDANRPVRMEVMALEDEGGGQVFIERAFHEICHALLFLTGQPDVSPVNVNDALVHYYLFQNPPQYKTMMDYVDYPKLQTALSKIVPNAKIKIRKIGWTDAEKGLYIPFDTPETQAEIIGKINEILPKYELDNTKEYNLGLRPF